MEKEFMVLASHEFRTPLSVISGNVELLENEYFGKVDRIQMKRLEIIRRSLDRLIRFTENMYDISLFEKSLITLRFEMVDVSEFTEMLKEDFAPLLGRRAFIINMPEKLSVMIDEDRFHSALSNLINNAIRYSEDNSIITLNIYEDGNDVHFEIKDEGVGIPREECEKIFEPFYQIEEIMHHSNGFGLGLTTAKKVIELHDGNLWLESTVGCGSTFHIKIPKERGIQNTKEWKRIEAERMGLY